MKLLSDNLNEIAESQFCIIYVLFFIDQNYMLLV